MCKKKTECLRPKTSELSYYSLAIQIGDAEPSSVAYNQWSSRARVATTSPPHGGVSQVAITRRRVVGACEHVQSTTWRCVAGTKSISVNAGRVVELVLTRRSFQGHSDGRVRMPIGEAAMADRVRATIRSHASSRHRRRSRHSNDIRSLQRACNNCKNFKSVSNKGSRACIVSNLSFSFLSIPMRR